MRNRHGGEGGNWKSPSVTEWYLMMKEGVANHVLAIPFELYEMLMDVHKEQKQGRLGNWVGAAGKRETYSTLNIMAIAIDSVVGEMSKDQAFEAMRRSEERTRIIPNRSTDK